MSDGCVEVDFSPLLTPGVQFAIRCETEEEAQHLIDAMYNQYPEKMRYWDGRRTAWNSDNYGTDGGRAYFPDLNDEEDEDFMQGSVSFADAAGYTLVYFSDLVIQDSQIQESDMEIGELFGINGFLATECGVLL